jgi:hypothetical protein
LWTAPDGVNTFFQLLIGYLLGALWPCLSDIVFRIWSWLKFCWHRFHQRPSPSCLRPRPEEHEPLLSANHNGGHYGNNSYTNTRDPIIDNSNSTPAPVRQNGNPSPQQQQKTTNPRKSKRGRGSILISILISIACAVAGTFATVKPHHQSGLSASKVCGMWSLRANNSDDDSESRDNLIQAQKETRAGQYATWMPLSSVQINATFSLPRLSLVMSNFRMSAPLRIRLSVMEIIPPSHSQLASSMLV